MKWKGGKARVRVFLQKNIWTVVRVYGGNSYPENMTAYEIPSGREFCLFIAIWWPRSIFGVDFFLHDVKFIRNI